jgi:MFS family permease
MTGTGAVAVMVAITGLSLFYRSCLGVIAPELTRDLGLTPEDLGNANGAFFLSIAVMQVPVGLLFDRYGPRRVVSWLTVLAVLAAALHGMVRTPGELVAVRLLLGIGCAGSFMGAVTLCALWYPGGKLATMLSRVFAFSQIGTFLAATPLALAEATIGWRWSFGAMAAITAATGLFFFFLIRDKPGATRQPETPREVLRGLLEVWRTPGLLALLGVHTFAYASMATVLGLWAGPYLAHVHGMDGTTRGNVLFAMAAAQLLGILAFGPLDRIFDTRKWIIVPGGLLSVGLLGAMALIPGLPVAAAVALLILFTGVTAYAVVIVAHGRSLFPDHLLGRGVTTVNIAQVIGLTMLPLITGPIVGAFPAPGAVSPEIAYRAAFGAIALLLAAGVAVYAMKAKDAKPSSTRE